jgi:hypothetical protein
MPTNDTRSKWSGVIRYAQCMSRIRNSWVGSYAGRVGSMNAPLGSRGGSAEVLQLGRRDVQQVDAGLDSHPARSEYQ